MIFLVFVMVRPVVNCFADDLKLYSPVDLKDGHSPSLQCSLDKVYEWSVKWQLPVNAEKCFGIQLSRSRLRSDSCDIARFDYLIGSRVLLSRSCVEDLGVNYDCNLHFDKHIDSIVSAARAKVGLFFRDFKTRDVAILRRAYVTYIRPTLEYASNVWNPYAKKAIYKLQGVQRYFTKRIPQLASLPYFERLAFLNLYILERRRLKTDLVSYF